ncbi:hypothetical protein QYE76_027110 [Lolium multiflorum]|uniref:Uncharacterized protein n=1 Tax=Lolium multiflorum TaxID=4521 RepID=A0AAD8QGN4_LOLMU|nr:hypothetical protein QYE76_027110 [Lolium multiflorum]
MWIIKSVPNIFGIDTLLRAPQGAIMRVPMHKIIDITDIIWSIKSAPNMSHHLGKARTVIDSHHLMIVVDHHHLMVYIDILPHMIFDDTTQDMVMRQEDESLDMKTFLIRRLLPLAPPPQWPLPRHMPMDSDATSEPMTRARVKSIHDKVPISSRTRRERQVAEERKPHVQERRREDRREEGLPARQPQARHCRPHRHCRPEHAGTAGPIEVNFISTVDLSSMDQDTFCNAPFTPLELFLVGRHCRAVAAPSGCRLDVAGTAANRRLLPRIHQPPGLHAAAARHSPGHHARSSTHHAPTAAGRRIARSIYARAARPAHSTAPLPHLALDPWPPLSFRSPPSAQHVRALRPRPALDFQFHLLRPPRT